MDATPVAIPSAAERIISPCNAVKHDQHSIPSQTQQAGPMDRHQHDPSRLSQYMLIGSGRHGTFVECVPSSSVTQVTVSRFHILRAGEGRGQVGQKDPRIPHSRSNPPCRSLLMLVTTDHGDVVGSRQRAADFFIACLHVCILVAHLPTSRPSCCRMTMAKAGGHRVCLIGLTSLSTTVLRDVVHTMQGLFAARW